MESSRITVSESEILQAIREAAQKIQVGPDDAFTANELADASGLHIRRVRALLQKVKAEGGLDCVKVRREGMDGRNALVPAYRIKPGALAE